MKFHTKLTSAHALGAVAIFIALSGSALAVSKNSITSKQVKNGSLAGIDVRDDSLTGSDINEGSLNLPASATGASPIGPAGGALTGEFPNPGLAVDSVDSAQILNNAVDSGEISSSAVGAVEVENRSLDAVDVGNTSGSVSVDPPSMSPGNCIEIQVDLGNNTSLANDAFAITMDNGWPAVLSVTSENSNDPGKVLLDVCHNGANTLDQGPTQMHWVSFDV